MLGVAGLYATTNSEETEMKMIFNAIYTAIFLSFLRKITDKVTEEFKWEIPYYRVDDSGCFNILIDETPVAYSFDRRKAVRLASHIEHEFPQLAGRLKITEDEDSEVEYSMIRGLDAYERKRLSEVIREFDED